MIRKFLAIAVLSLVYTALASAQLIVTPVAGVATLDIASCGQGATGPNPSCTFKLTLTANATLAFNNVFSGASIGLFVNPSTFTLTWPTSVVSPPALTPSQNNSVSLRFDGTTGTWLVTSGGASSPTFPVNSQTVSYQTVAVDFSSFKTIVMNGASLTLTLLAAAPTAGQGILVENLNATTLTIARNGLNIDGAASNLTIPQNVGVVIISDGSNYFTQRGGAGSVALSPTAAQTIQAVVDSVPGLTIKGFSTTGSRTHLSVQRSDGNVMFAAGQQNVGNGVFTFGAAGLGGNQYLFGENGVVVTTGNSNLDFPIITAASATTPTTPVGSTSLLASAPAGTYEVSYYSVVTTSGVGGTSFVLNFIYTDAQQAQTIPAFTNSTFTGGNVNQGTFIIQNQGATNINYSITENGAFSTHPILALKLVLKRIL